MNLSGDGVMPDTRAIAYVKGVHSSGIRTDIEHTIGQCAVSRRRITRGTPEFLACLSLQGIYLTAWTCFVVHACVEHSIFYLEVVVLAVLPIIEELATRYRSIY